MQSRVTIRELAELAGFSQTTVSLALRHHPKIPVATRRRIEDLAKTHGYVRDPLMSTLMTHMRMTRHHRTTEKLALLSWWQHARDAGGAALKSELHEGIRERAATLGYQIEEFQAGAPGMSGSRLSDILYARGIRGVILLSKLEPRGRVHLKWARFAVATTNYTILKPGMHRATHSHFQGMILTLRQLRHLGYARAGYVNTFLQEDRVNDGWLAGYMAYHYRTLGELPLAPLLRPEIDRESLRDWLRAHRPDVVISNNVQVLRLLQELGLRVPADIGFASLDCVVSEVPCAGVDQQRRKVGASSVDLVVQQLESNELGLPAVHKTVSTDGAWVDGPTLRKV